MYVFDTLFLNPHKPRYPHYITSNILWNATLSGDTPYACNVSFLHDVCGLRLYASTKNIEYVTNPFYYTTNRTRFVRVHDFTSLVFRKLFN